MGKSKSMIFGKRIRQLMSDRAYTSADIESKTGIPRESVEIWLSPEHINNADTVRSNLVALCGVFNCTAGYLLGTTDDCGTFRPHKKEAFVPLLYTVLARYGKTLHGMFGKTHIADNHMRVWKTGGEPLASDIFALSGYIGCEPDELV